MQEAKNRAPVQVLTAVDHRVVGIGQTGVEILPDLDLIAAETSLRARLAKRRANRRRPILYED